MEATCFFETSIGFQQNIRCYISQPPLTEPQILQMLTSFCAINVSIGLNPVAQQQTSYSCVCPSNYHFNHPNIAVAFRSLDLGFLGSNQDGHWSLLMKSEIIFIGPSRQMSWYKSKHAVNNSPTLLSVCLHVLHDHIISWHYISTLGPVRESNKAPPRSMAYFNLRPYNRIRRPKMKKKKRRSCSCA
jgi:hypothetical protein